jgi:hypothetical protein
MLNNLQKTIIARVDPAAKKAFAVRAKQRRMTQSELLRALILTELGLIAPPSHPVVAEAENVSQRSINVRLAGFLLAAAKDRAAARRMSTSRWIASLVQSNLIRDPVLTEPELLAVQAASRELAAIGRNLNQIARRLNDAFYETERVRIDLLSDLAESIKQERQAIRALVRASKQGWEADAE